MIETMTQSTSNALVTMFAATAVLCFALAIYLESRPRR